MSKTTQKSQANTVRIIGGHWRSRKLSFPTATGLRPTGDRIRETLFNWLGDHISAARCLDLFAGSGALGFEALSRGAAHLTLVENNRLVTAQLQRNAQMLETEDATIVCNEATDWLKRQPSGPAFNIIFLDPPFDLDIAHEVIALLDSKHLIKPGGFIYLETPIDRRVATPRGWELWREKVTGAVRYQLWHCH